MTKLIGLTGLAGSGKDTAAQALINLGWKRDAFADRMRTAMLALDPIINMYIEPGAFVDEFGDLQGTYGTRRLSDFIERFGWDESKRRMPEIRRLLQKFGTEAGRDIHGENCWVDALFRGYDEWGVYNDLTGLVITDVRFDNEAQAIHDRGGIIMKIERDGLERLPGGNSAHASEAGLQPHLINVVIENNGSIEDLHHEVRMSLYEEIWERT